MKDLKFFSISTLYFILVFAQAKSEILDTLEKFSIEKEVAVTAIKNQYKSNTCWSYSVLGQWESELLQNGKGNYNLSEAFIVRQVYIEKAEKYIRLHGKMSFTGGGALNDPIEVIKKYGIMPEEAYSGLKAGVLLPDHLTMDGVLKDYVDGQIKNKKLSPEWKEGFIGLLDAYIGKAPDKFQYNGKEYTPKTFAESLGIRPDNYVLLTSFVYKPFYEPFIVEVPDNWSSGVAYNVTLTDLIRIVNNSLAMGHSVSIAADVSESGFKWDKGMALAVESDVSYNNDVIKDPGIFIAKKDTTPQIIKELVVTQELRQQEFDNYETTDDHGLLVVGIAHDQKGKKFYKVKNSWGTDGTCFNGFLYMSEAYLSLKTITLLVNKNTIPKDILQKFRPKLP